jgi:hypothetical protein
MARKIRIEFAGATCHVMARGNQGCDVYAGDQDRKLRLETLAEAPEDRLGEGAPLKGRRGSHSGGAKQEHGEARAQRLLRLGLPLAGLAEGDLAGGPKGALEKRVLAWWLCGHTTVRRRWVSQRLGMGGESRVTHAIRQVRSGVGMEKLKERLERAYKSTHPVDL